MEEKVKIIDEITLRHPSLGVDKGWSYYVGGMRDSGGWYFRKMLDVPIEELQSFLNQIIVDEETGIQKAAEEKKRIAGLSPEEKKYETELISINGFITTRKGYDDIEKHIKEMERKMFFGLYAIPKTTK